MIIKNILFLEKNSLIAFRKIATLIIFLSILYIQLIFIIPVKAESNNLPKIIISEVNYRGSISESNCKVDIEAKSRCSFDKWIEFYNPTKFQIDLSNWKLKFYPSSEFNDTFNFPNIKIDPKENIILGFTEKNYNSILKTNGIEPEITSYKVKNLSNNSIKRIWINLLDEQEKVVDFAILNTDQINKFESNFEPQSLHSIERTGIKNNWAISNKNFIGNNYGSPKTINSGLIQEIQNQEIQVVEKILEIKSPSQNPQISTVKKSIVERAQIPKKATETEGMSKPQLAHQEAKSPSKIAELEKIKNLKIKQEIQKIQIPKVITKPAQTLKESKSESNLINQIPDKIESKESLKRYRFNISSLLFISLTQLSLIIGISFFNKFNQIREINKIILSLKLQVKSL